MASNNFKPKGFHMNKQLLARAIFAGAALAVTVLPAQAIPVTYALQDVTFSDGTSASGQFTWDADTASSSGFSIVTQDGQLPAFTYDNTNSSTGNWGSGLNNIMFLKSDGSRYFTLSFFDALSNAGGTYAINTAGSWDCTNCGNYRMVTGGSVSSLAAEVPEPATALLMLPMLGFLAARRRKQ